jgi:MscS family membrane protein
VALGAFVAHEHVRLPDPYYGIVEKLIVSICVAAVFKVIHSMCNLIPQLYETRRALRTLDQTTLVVRVAQVISAFVGVAAVLKVWGIDVGPVLTGMGVAGAAVALASQDYLKNLLAGFNNATERRFREGDWIQVDGLVEGIVESIDLRSTLLRRFDLAPVHVANADLASGALINFGRRPHRKIYWKISLKYNLSVKTLRAIRERVERYIDGSDYFESPDVASRFVRIDSFSESSIDMLVYCFTHSPAYGDYLEAKEDLALAIKSIVEEKGGAFAYPSRSIYIEESAWAGPDRFKGSEPEDKRVDRKMD